MDKEAFSAFFGKLIEQGQKFENAERVFEQRAESVNSPKMDDIRKKALEVIKVLMMKDEVIMWK